jgi:hypothetical protein
MATRAAIWRKWEAQAGKAADRMGAASKASVACPLGKEPWAGVRIPRDQPARIPGSGSNGEAT